MPAKKSIKLPTLNTNHRNILRRAIMQEKKEAGSYFTVGKAVSNRNHGYSNALTKLEGLGLIEAIREGERVANWQIRLLVCPIELSELLSPPAKLGQLT